MSASSIKCPDCGEAGHMVPAARPHRKVDSICAVYFGAIGVGALEADKRAWSRGERCGNLVRQSRGRVSNVLTRVFFGSRARSGTVIRSEK